MWLGWWTFGIGHLGEGHCGGLLTSEKSFFFLPKKYSDVHGRECAKLCKLLVVSLGSFGTDMGEEISLTFFFA